MPGPCTAEDIRRLDGYRGADACPGGSDAFWGERIAEADATSLSFPCEPVAMPAYPACGFFDVWFVDVDGAHLRAKYVRSHSPQPVPLVLRFHGYTGASRGWLEQRMFAGMGMAPIVFDCPGQGGSPQDVGSCPGTTVTGHLVAGLEGGPENLHYVRAHQNIRSLFRIVEELPEIERSRVYVNRASQGGSSASQPVPSIRGSPPVRPSSIHGRSVRLRAFGWDGLCGRGSAARGAGGARQSGARTRCGSPSIPSMVMSASMILRTRRCVFSPPSKMAEV